MYTFILIGAGSRGRIYADLIQQSDNAQVIAVGEPNAARRADAAASLGIAENRCFETSEALLSEGKIADVCIIASMDRDHYAQAMHALELGYDLLLEKPISPDPAECLAIANLAEKLGRKVIVCHVLRYTPFFRTIKEIVDSGRLGRIVDIQHNENIGNFHMAHSFVRGNWRNAALSSPIILQKTCHDMDILVWLTGSLCHQISSFGSLTYFTEANAPANSAARCLDCEVAENCRFDARKCYLPIVGGWPATVLCVEQTEESVLEAIRTGPYGRCVYTCDNDVCDHQVAIMTFDHGVTATFNVSAFTGRIGRTLKIMFEHGELRASDADNVIEIAQFPSNYKECVRKEVIHPEHLGGGHGGGDTGLIRDLLDALANPAQQAVSAIAYSVESHLMSCAAEQSRLTGQSIDMAAYRAGLKTSK